MSLWFESSDPGKCCPLLVAGSASRLLPFPEPPAHAPLKDLAVFPPLAVPRGGIFFLSFTLTPVTSLVTSTAG